MAAVAPDDEPEPAKVAPTEPGPRAHAPVAAASTMPVSRPPALAAPTGRHLPPVFRAGDVVGGRYRVLRFIAAGGMGQVFEVHDQELDERLALKTLHPALAGDSQMARQFKLEIQLARKVTHANVCRIFDVAYHRFASGESAAFLTMELLEGKTLRSLARERALTGHEVRDLAVQLASGLAAAHAAGVVHRDFKSDNVILIPRQGGGWRAVITDFGIAVRSAAEDGSGGAHGFAGTADYIAPELVQGGEATRACDLYSFGVVLFELLARRMPFSGTTVLELAAARLTQEPPGLRALVPGVDDELAALVDAALLRDPAARVAAVEPRLRRLGATETPTRRRTVLLAVTLVLLALGAAVWATLEPEPAGVRAVRPTAPAHRITRRHYVRPFVDAARPGRISAAGLLAREALRAQLSDAPRLRTVPVTVAAEIERGLDLPPGPLGTAEAARAAILPQADFLVEGRLEEVDEGLRARVRVLDSAGVELGQLEATAGDLDALAADLGARILALEGQARTSPARSLLPRSQETRALYGDLLLADLLGDETKRAWTVDLLHRLEPDFALGAWLLLERSPRLSDESRAQLSARTTAGIPALPLDDGEQIAAMVLIFTGDPNTAVTRCEARAASDPLDPLLQVELANCLHLARQSQRALAVIERLERTGWNHVRLAGLQASVALDLQAYPRALPAAQACVALARRDRDRQVEVECLISVAAAAENLSQWDTAQRAVDAALPLAIALDDDPRIARVHDVQVRLLLDHGRLRSAERLLRERLAASVTVDQIDPLGHELSLARILSETGHVPAARAQLDAIAISLAKQVNTRVGGYAQGEAAKAALLAGDVTAADQRAGAALAMYAAGAQPRLLAYARMVAAMVRLEQRQLADAREKAEAALRYRRGAGLSRLASQTEILLARIDLADDAPLLADQRLSRLLGDPASYLLPSDRASALLLRAQVLIELERRGEARMLAASVRSIVPGHEDALLPLQLARIEALLDGLDGAVQPALGRLRKARAEALRGGYVFEAVELELTAARLEPSAPRARLLALEVVTRATELGLLELASRASALASQRSP
jgi:hypothetical protein